MNLEECTEGHTDGGAQIQLLLQAYTTYNHPVEMGVYRPPPYPNHAPSCRAY